MSRYSAIALLAVVVAAPLAGCGGGGGGGAVSQVSRAIGGRVDWPAGLGPVSQVQVTAKQVATSTGITGGSLGTAIYDPNTRVYQVSGVPANQTVVVEATGVTGSGVVARLAAMVLAAGRSRDPYDVIKDLGAGTTIAAAAATTLVQGGYPVGQVSTPLLTAMETASAPLADSVDVTNPQSVQQAAQQVITATSHVQGQGTSY